jgi:long-chain acyl-CoA synthetase
MPEIRSQEHVARPWLRFYGDVPPSLDYPAVTVDEAVMATARRFPDATAFDFLGTRVTYRELGASIERCAGALASLGLREGDRITISTPTCPQGVIAFYAASRVGAIPSMIHPLSTEPEIETYLRMSNSRFALTLDAFYGRFAQVRERTPLETLVLARIGDYLPPLKRVGFWLTRGRKIPRVPSAAPVVWWSDLLKARVSPPPPRPGATADDLAAILYSGGTTGRPKGIMLSHSNFVCEGMEAAKWVALTERDVVLAVLPIFHGFGLGVLVNASLMTGATVVMVPVFSAETVAKLMRTKRPTLMAGVPTLYEALTHDPALRKSDLSSLRAAFSGADTLPRSVKERFEELVAERGGSARLVEGYGLTETVTAIMCMPLDEYREGSIGVPFPDSLAAICAPGTDEELPAGEEGEICISGPAVMIGYLDNPEATAEALKVHPDGRVWLHSGDIGHRDEDGFFYFRTRLKRMIKSSGFNVYPSEVEAVLERHPAVVDACVIGVRDPAQGQRVKAFVKLVDPGRADDALAAELIEHCRRELIKWSCPREVEFRETLPVTRVGKIDYVALEREEASRLSS